MDGGAIIGLEESLQLNQVLQYPQETLEGHISTPSLDILTSTILSIDPIYFVLNILIIVAILFLTSTSAKIVDQALRFYIPKFAGKVEVKMDETMQLMIRRLVSAAIYAVGFTLVILQIPPLHSLAMAMLAGAGIATIAISFAAKDSLSNLTSGIFIAIFQPIRVGDEVDFRSDFGKIEDLTLRHTVIRTWDHRRIVVPNSIVSNEPIINWTMRDPQTTWYVDFVICRASDIDRARDIIIQEASAHPHVLKDQKILVLLTDAKEAKYNLRLFVRVSRRSIAYRMGCEIREGVEKKFEIDEIAIAK